MRAQVETTIQMQTAELVRPGTALEPGEVVSLKHIKSTENALTKHALEASPRASGTQGGGAAATGADGKGRTEEDNK